MVETPPTFLISSDLTTAFEKPVVSLAQFAPPSRVTKTPRSVPTYARCPLLGSITTLHAGISGIALTFPGVCDPSTSVQVAPPSADLKTWPKPLPLEAELKFETVAQTMLVFDGSYSTHEMPPKPLPRGVND